MIFSYLLNMQSHPSWVCGLKQRIKTDGIETDIVTPFVGVWIETKNKDRRNRNRCCHTLRGCVD